jgi:hypothetical protein
LSPPRAFYHGCCSLSTFVLHLRTLHMLRCPTWCIRLVDCYAVVPHGSLPLRAAFMMGQCSFCPGGCLCVRDDRGYCCCLLPSRLRLGYWTGCLVVLPLRSVPRSWVDVTGWVVLHTFDGMLPRCIPLRYLIWIAVVTEYLRLFGRLMSLMPLQLLLYGAMMMMMVG